MHPHERRMYLVDGNNVIGQRVGWHRDKPGARRRLLAELAGLRRAADQAFEVRVVFDGRPPPELVDGALVDGVEVFFARPGSDADHRILELAGEAPAPDEIIVVTSDRELAHRVAELGVRTVRSGRFREMLDSL